MIQEFDLGLLIAGLGIGVGAAWLALRAAFGHGRDALRHPRAERELLQSLPDRKSSGRDNRCLTR